MKLWKSYDPRLQKSLRILTWSVVGLIAAYIALSVVLALCTEADFFDGWFILLMMGFIGLVLSPILLAIANFIRSRLTAQYRVPIPDGRLDKALSTAAAISGLLALALYLLGYRWDYEFRYPWSDVYISTQIDAFGSVALMICLAAMVVNLLAQVFLKLLQKKQGADEVDRYSKRTRVVAGVLIGLICLGCLLIPQPQGHYNDGGSKFYKAVLYEVIDWNRAETSNGMAVPDDFDADEVQHTRVYFFPFNCYTYNAKWEMKH